MKQENRYYKFSKISEAKFRELLRYFALDLTATEASVLSGLSLRSVNTLWLSLRYRLWEECQKQTPFSGVLEMDESYFGARRVKGKRGRGAGGKTIVFGLLKRGDKVYTEIVPNAGKVALQKIIRGKASIDSELNSDGWRGYDGLVDVGFDKHFRVNHGKDEFVRGSHHVNGIESFWGYAKGRLGDFYGVPRHTFLLHLKETEFRFNHRAEDLYKVLLQLLRQESLVRWSPNLLARRLAKEGLCSD